MRSSRRPARLSARRALVVPVVVLCLLGLIGVLAIAIDGGLLLDERRQVQAAADAAALAAAVDLFTNYNTNQGTDPKGTAAKSAQTTAAANGFKDGGNSTVTVNIPPTSGTFTGKAGYAEVIIKYNQGRYFSAIWGSSKLAVQARAVARGIWKNSGIGILLLDPSGSSLSLSGNGAVVVNNGGSVVVNSTNPAAITLSGNGDVTANKIDIGGNPGYSTSGNGTFQGTIKAGAAPTPDPLSAVPGITTPPVPVTTYSGQSVISSGTYTNGINLSNGSVTLQSGVYYIEGSITLSGQSSLTGNGVMLYLAPGASINISGQASITLTPPTGLTGAQAVYNGITIFQDRRSSASITLSGKGNIDISGTLYAPKGTFSFSGNGAIDNIGSEVIGYDLSASGNGTMTVNASGGAGNKRQVQLVE